VLIGLIFLIVEINQNSRIATATAHLALAQDRRDTFEYANSFTEIDGSFRRGEELSGRDALIARRIYSARIGTYESQWHFWRNGLVDDEQFEAYKLQILGTISTPTIRNLWEFNKNVYHPDFVQLVDGLLSESL